VETEGKRSMGREECIEISCVTHATDKDDSDVRSSTDHVTGKVRGQFLEELPPAWVAKLVIQQ